MSEKLRSYLLGYDIHSREVVNYKTEEDAVRNSIVYHAIEASNIYEARQQFHELYAQNERYEQDTE